MHARPDIRVTNIGLSPEYTWDTRAVRHAESRCTYRASLGKYGVWKYEDGVEKTLAYE